MELDFEISEKKLEEIVYSHLMDEDYYEGLGDIKEDYEKLSFCKRQYNAGAYGIIDILCITEPDYEGYYYIKIIELKKGKIDASALGQVLRYTKCIIEHLSYLETNIRPKIRPILIGGSVVDELLYLPQTSNIEIYTYGIDSKGITFENNKKWHHPGFAKNEETLNILRCMDLLSSDNESKYYIYGGI